MIKWLRAIYADEIDTHEQLQIEKERKLLRVLLITERVNSRQDVQLAHAFKLWKRMEYQFVLDGLRKYSALLDKNQVQNLLTTTDDFDPDEDDGADIFLCTDEQEDYECLPISSRSNRVYLTSLGH